MTSIRWPLVSLVAAIFALATALWSAPAAELLTAEVDGTVPIDVTVEQGATAPFTIYVSASGAIRCTNTAANPSSAKVHTSYAISSGGAVSSATFSSGLSFFAGAGSGTNCPITWTDPAPATDGLQALAVAASASVGALTPVGNYSVVLSTASGRTQVSNPNSSGGKLEDGTSTTLIFHVIAPAPPADTTPPVIVPQVTPAPNASGWNNTDVNVSWSVTDPQSTVSSSSGCGPSTLTAETAGATLTCSAMSAGGADSESVTIRIDKTAPQISGSRNPEPNSTGWNSTDVTVSFTCADTGAVQSGVASDTVAGDTVTSEGTDPSVTNSGACVDNAGNVAPSATVGDINIDKTNPQVSGSRDPEANSNGWNNTDVAVSFTCADSGPVQSGIATDTVAGDTLSDEGAGQSVTNSGACVDNAGNVAPSATVGDINIDKTNPQVSGSRDPEAKSNGWNNTDVAVSFTCADSGPVQSGIATDTVAGDTLSDEGAGQSVTNSGACVDNAGNAALSASVGDINIDKTNPLITGSRDPEANANGWNNTDVVVSFICADTGDVQADIATDSVTGDTLSDEGAGQSVTNGGACVDNAGNAALSASVGDINIDKTNPLITGSRDPEANANGWNNADVTVSFACADAGAIQSGIATDTVAGDTLSGEGAGQSVTNGGACVDNAGNVALSASVGDINIDKTNPQITGSRDPEANANGWNNTEVVVSFTCADSGSIQSGIATDTVAGDTVTSEGAGQSVTNGGACVDNAGNAALSASVGDINIDKTNPQITGSRDPEANANGWNNADVTVSFACADAGAIQSGIATDSVSGDTLSGEGAGQSVTNGGACVDNAGNVALSASVGDINIDKTNPLITGSRDPEANANGWNNTDVVVSFICADTGDVQADIATDSVTGDTLSDEGADQSVTNGGACVDHAGNAAASASVGDINIDKTNPQISGNRSPQPNSNGWNNSDVAVSFTCADTGAVQSGIATDSVAGDTVTSEGAGQSVTNGGACVDNAGNAALSASVGDINIDKTNPQITGSRDPEANANGWNNSDVTVRYDCTDSLSLVGFETADQVVSAEGAGQSRSGTCIDNAGNFASTSVLNINIDKTSPAVAITGFSDDDAFYTGQALPTPGCATPEDSLSGVASSNGPSLIEGGLNANGVGYVGYECSATDRAGNAASASAGFSVSYGGVSGILQPINPDNSSVFKRGHAVPVKFRLAGDEFSGFATEGWSLKRVQVSCSTLADLTVAEDVSSVTPSSVFRYDASADQYIYNADFRTVNPGTCWRVRVTLDDGTVLYSAYFKINR